MRLLTFLSSSDGLRYLLNGINFDPYDWTVLWIHGNLHHWNGPFDCRFGVLLTRSHYIIRISGRVAIRLDPLIRIPLLSKSVREFFYILTWVCIILHQQVHFICCNHIVRYSQSRIQLSGTIHRAYRDTSDSLWPGFLLIRLLSLLFFIGIFQCTLNWLSRASMHVSNI